MKAQPDEKCHGLGNQRIMLEHKHGISTTLGSAGVPDGVLVVG